MKKTYQAILFDLDGTLLDTVADLHAAVNHVLRLFHEPEITLEEARSHVGNGNRRLMARSLALAEKHPQFDQMFEEFVSYYLAHDTEHTSVYLGIPEFLSAAANRGIKMGVVTNKFQSAATELMEHFFPDTFGSVVGERVGIPRKPAPQQIEIALADLGVSAKDALYIGDSEVDADTAENAGMDYCLVSWGFKERHFLEGRHPILLADDPKELMTIL